MAVIGTATGTFLAPGVSGNRRLYTREHIAGAVARMKERLASDEALPITMLSHHDARDDSKELTGRVTSVQLQPDGSASFEATIVDTQAGRDILAAIEPDEQGRRVLDAVSIRGAWLGPVKTVSHEGQTVTTGTDLEIDGIDWTKSPGVSAARLSTTARAAESTAERSPIYEEAPMTVAPAPTVADAAAACEAFIKVCGSAGPADVLVDAFVGSDEIAGAAQKVVAAFTAAMKVLDPDMDDDLHLPDGTELPDSAVFQSNSEEPTVAEKDEKGRESADENAAESAESVSETGGDEQPETDTVESGETAENTQVSGVTDSQLGDIVSRATEAVLAALAEKGASESAPSPAPVSESAVAEATQRAVGEAMTDLLAKIETKLGETKDALRADIVKAYGPPPRAGLVKAAESEPEKPTHEMTREEFDRFASERIEAVFGGVVPRHPRA